MTYEKFCEELKQKLDNHEYSDTWTHEFYDDGFTSSDEDELLLIRRTNLKYHKTESDTLIGDFLIMRDVHDNYTGICRFEMEYLYDSFKTSGWEFVKDIIQQNIQISNDSQNSVIERLDNYDSIKEQLIIRPLNYKANYSELQSCIFKKIGDIALVLYAVAVETKTELGTIKVPKVYLSKWGLSKDEVLDYALANSNVKYPPRMYMNPHECANPPYTLGAFMALDYDVTRLDDYVIPVLTCTRQDNGATGLFYTGVMEKISKLYGESDYYVVFTGISDVRVHKIGTVNPRDVLRNLKASNKMFPDTMLSNKIYQYKHDTGELTALEL